MRHFESGKAALGLCGGRPWGPPGKHPAWLPRLPRSPGWERKITRLRARTLRMKHPISFKSQSLRPYFAAALAAWAALSAPLTAQAQPKYGPSTTRLSQDHAYFQTAKTTDFWSLIPYYVPQVKENNCGMASIAMTLNAARAHLELDQDTPLVTEAALESKVGSLPLFGMNGLEHLQTVSAAGFEKYGMKNVRIDVIRLEPSEPKALDRLRAILKASERNQKTFLIANFDQNAFTDDMPIGHIAPVGAYDSIRKRVLVLDPDREWYEPYWIPDTIFLKGLQTQDPFIRKTRGLVRIQLPD